MKAITILPFYLVAHSKFVFSAAKHPGRTRKPEKAAGSNCLTVDPNAIVLKSNDSYLPES